MAIQWFAPGEQSRAHLLSLKQIGRTDNPAIQHFTFQQLPFRTECFPDKADAFAHHHRDGVDG